MIIKLNQDYTATLLTDIEPCEKGLRLSFQNAPAQNGTASLIHNGAVTSAPVRDGACLIGTDFIGECEIVYGYPESRRLWRCEPIYIDGTYARGINLRKTVAKLSDELDAVRNELKETKSELIALARKVSSFENHDLI